MRICYLSSDRGIPLAGHKGASAHVRGLVRAFAALGHDVVLLSPDTDGAPADLGASVRRIPAPGLLDGLREGDSPRVYRALGHVWNNAVVESALEQAVLDHRPDLIYERYAPFAIAGSVVAGRHAIPHLLEVNAPLAWEGARFRRQALRDAAEVLESAAFRNAGRLLVVSGELRDLLIEAGHDGNRIAIVPNGVDASHFARVERRAHTDRVTLGFIGSLKPWHGLEYLCDAFRSIAADERFHLLVVGEGPSAGVLNEVAAEHPGRVTLTGAVPHDHVPALLYEMDIAVAPYPLMEPFYFSPLKVLEYMAAGLPVVASAIGQLRDLIRHDETGILVAPGEPTELSVAFLRLADDAGLRRRLGEAAALEVLAHHTWVQRAEHIVELADSATLATPLMAGA